MCGMQYITALFLHFFLENVNKLLHIAYCVLYIIQRETSIFNNIDFQVRLTTYANNLRRLIMQTR